MKNHYQPRTHNSQKSAAFDITTDYKNNMIKFYLFLLDGHKFSERKIYVKRMAYKSVGT